MWFSPNISTWRGKGVEIGSIMRGNPFIQQNRHMRIFFDVVSPLVHEYRFGKCVVNLSKYVYLLIRTYISERLIDTQTLSITILSKSLKEKIAFHTNMSAQIFKWCQNMNTINDILNNSVQLLMKRL